MLAGFLICLRKSRENRLFLYEMRNSGSIILRNRVWKVYSAIWLVIGKTRVM